MTVQEARLGVAMADLNAAQAQLDEKEAELAVVRAMYDKAMAEKQVWASAREGVLTTLCVCVWGCMRACMCVCYSGTASIHCRCQNTQHRSPCPLNRYRLQQAPAFL